MTGSDSPIGVFDSGVGGLSVLRAMRRELPPEDLLYVADSVHAPYGEKSTHFIEQRSLAITEFLLAQGAKAIVVACNTATGAAIAMLRARFSVPIIGMEPAIKPAVGRTGSGVVGVLATAGTASSEKFNGLLARFERSARVLVQPCPGLVEQVEAGELESVKTRGLVQKYVLPLLEQRADTIVLGCTHYPFLMPMIQEIAGPSVAVIEPSDAVAREVSRRLQNQNLRSAATRRGVERFWTSATLSCGQTVLERLWGTPVTVLSFPLSNP